MNTISTESGHVSAITQGLIDAHIEIVGSTNPRINAMAHDARVSIHAALSERYRKVGISIVDNFEDLEQLAAKKPDLVILGMKLVLLDPSKNYDDSPKVWLSEYLGERNIHLLAPTQPH